MTTRARIPQDDMTRVLKAVARSGAEGARVVFDLANERIEVIMGESGDALPMDDSWDDEDT